METPQKRPWFTIVLNTILPATVTLVLFALTIIFFAIPQYKEAVYKEKRQLIKDMTNMGYSLLEHYYQRTVTGELSVEESQRRVVERFRFIRYGPEQKDYFWISNLDVKLVMHPYRTDLEGKDVSEYSDPQGNFLFMQFAEIARTQKAGYAEYMWQWKDNPNQIAPKISYVRAFEPWGWIIGTGVYMEEVREEIVAITQKLQMIFTGAFLIVFITSIYLVGHGIRVEMLRRKAEEERGNLLEKLEEKNRQIQDFVYAVSHDLRAPLINIRGFSKELTVSCQEILSHSEECGENLPESVVSCLAREEMEESIQFIQSNAEKMESLINGLLELSRVGSRSMTIQSVDMNAELEKVVQVLQFQIKSTQAQIHLESLPPCFADRDQVNQIFCNLIDNALKYRHPDRAPKIRIAGTSKSREVEYTVADNGIGIEADQLGRIFDIFSQINPNSSMGGVGLGLTIVKRILELMGGQIQVRSRPGEGTMFTVTLPAG